MRRNLLLVAACMALAGSIGTPAFEELPDNGRRKLSRRDVKNQEALRKAQAKRDRKNAKRSGRVR